LTLTLAVAEATDYVTATAGNASGIASFEFKYGTETGVYGDPVISPRNFTDIYSATEALFVCVRGIAFDGAIGEWSDEATISIAKNDFVSFEFPESVGESVIDAVAHTVAVTVDDATDPSSLVAAFTVSDGATVFIGEVEQESETTENNFTAPVTYNIISREGEVEQEWVVTVTVQVSEKDFTAFTIPNQVGETVINAGAHTIALTMPDDTNPAALVAEFTLENEATCKVVGTEQESGVTANDFTNPVVYTSVGRDATEQAWTITVTIAKDTAKALTAFTVPGQVGDTVIDEEAKTVALNVPHATDVSNLVATFTISAEAAATVGAVAQVSGVTTNDFTAPVIYRVTAENLSFADYTVTITINAPTNHITAFTVPEISGAAVIDAEAHTVALNVVDDTSPVALVATFGLTAGATAAIAAVPQESGVTDNDFTNPVVYVVTGADLVAQNWTVTVTVLSDTAKVLSAFSVPGQVGDAVIDQEAHTVAVSVPHDTDVSALVATFTVSAEASAKIGAVVQESGVTANDFGAPVTYRVTAEDLTFQDYVVTVAHAAATTDITAFAVPGQTGDATIDATAHTVAITVPHATVVTALAATFGVTAGAAADVSDTPQESGVTANDFTDPVVYTITGADAAEQNWTVTITKAAATNDITAFSMAEQTGAAVIDADEHTIDIEVAALTDVDHLVATFTLTASAVARVGSTIQVSGDTQNDFTAPVVYAVTGADTVVQNWTVTVTVAA
jgi:hypothetical protein